jgi:hypothetical protein
MGLYHQGQVLTSSLRDKTDYLSSSPHRSLQLQRYVLVALGKRTGRVNLQSDPSQRLRRAECRYTQEIL